MGRITEEQNAILNSFDCVRVRESEPSLLKTIKGPEIKGVQTSIADLFCCDAYVNDDKNGDLASYLILAPKGMVLGFFSIRCGELFKCVDFKRMKMGCDAYKAMLNASKKQSPKHLKKAKQNVTQALKYGISYDEFIPLYKKKKIYLADVATEPDKSVKRISDAYPGVELKFFGTNENSSDYWKSLGFSSKMGETLFWKFVIQKVEEMRETVGCRFLYLFAADLNAEGRLVNYYRSILHIDAQLNYSANKPHFDYNSKFLYQEISELVKQKEYFFEHFNRDMEEFV